MKKLIALTLALLLAVLLLPTIALAEEENNVAKNINKDKEYASLRDALGDANDGDTITILKDCELSNGYDSIRVLKSITLDLNGCTMTLKSLISVQNYATFTIQNGETTGGIKVGYKNVFEGLNGTTVKLIGVKITEADTTEKGRLFNATSGSNFIVENCDITWSGICWLNGDSATIENTRMELTGSNDAFIMDSSSSRLEIINSTIIGKGAKLYITPDTNKQVDRPSVSIANVKPQSGIIEYSYYYEFNNGKFILPGVSDASAKLKAMLADSFRSATLLVPSPDGLYLSSSALEYLGDAKNGETYTIEQAGPQEQMEELARAGAVPANGCTIVNGTADTITVNEVALQPGQSHTFTEKGPELDPAQHHCYHPSHGGGSHPAQPGHRRSAGDCGGGRGFGHRGGSGGGTAAAPRRRIIRTAGGCLRRLSFLHKKALAHLPHAWYNEIGISPDFCDRKGVTQFGRKKEGRA